MAFWVQDYFIFLDQTMHHEFNDGSNHATLAIPSPPPLTTNHIATRLFVSHSLTHIVLFPTSIALTPSFDAPVTFAIPNGTLAHGMINHVDVGGGSHHGVPIPGSRKLFLENYVLVAVGHYPLRFHG